MAAQIKRFDAIAKRADEIPVGRGKKAVYFDGCKVFPAATLSPVWKLSPAALWAAHQYMKSNPHNAEAKVLLTFVAPPLK